MITNRDIEHRYKNKKTKARTLQKGDRVLFRNFAKQNKLQLNWIGPGEVMELTSHKMKIRINNKIHYNIHINHVLALSK